jgi:hypothetical protein
MRRLVARLVALGAIGVLAGCAPAPPADMAQGRCQLQADKDPAVQELIFQQLANPGEPGIDQQLALARRKAVNACLDAAGVATRGGVEPVSRAHYGLGWY